LVGIKEAYLMNDPIAVLRERVQRAKRLYEERQKRHKAGDPKVSKEMVLDARDKFRALRAELERERKAFQPWMLNGHPGNITEECKRAIVRGVRAGLVVTATTDGDHAETSLHYPRNTASGLGEAVDFGVKPGEVGDPKAVARRERFQRKEFARGVANYRELFGPSNVHCAKNGLVFHLTEGDALETAHDNHVHESPMR
jgi:hypothetical protein